MSRSHKLSGTYLHDLCERLVRTSSDLDNRLAALETSREGLIKRSAAQGDLASRERWALLIYQLDRRIKLLAAQRAVAQRQLLLVEQLVYAKEQAEIVHVLEDWVVTKGVSWSKALSSEVTSARGLARRHRLVEDFLAWLEGLTGSQPAPPVSPNTEWAMVRRVPDGDGAVLEDRRRVRYLGIDAPETNYFGWTDPYSQEAKALNHELVAGQRVWLERDRSDTDRYGRLLRYVWAGDTFVNAELVRQGAAYALAVQPDTRHQALFARLEAEARRAGWGLWAE